MNLFSLEILAECYFGLMIVFIFLFGLFNKKINISSELIFQSQLLFFWLIFIFLSYIPGNFKHDLNSFFLDKWSLLLKLLILVLGFFYFFFLNKSKFEYVILLLVFFLSTFFLLSSMNLLVLYISLELSSFVLYLIVSSNRTSLSSTEAGLKYFVLGSFASILFILGISLIYGIVGSLEFKDISLFGFGLNWESGLNLLTLGHFFIVFGLFFKLGMAPFHFWVADVYQGSNWLTVLFLASLSKIGIFGLLIRLNYDVFFFDFELSSFFFFISGLLYLCIGTFGSLRQVDLRRLVGYSGISHMGFIAIGLSIGTGVSLLSTFVYFCFYLLLTMSWIILIMHMDSILLKELKGLSTFLNYYLILIMFSISGIPPLGGFFIKFYLFFSLLQLNLFFCLFLLFFFSLVSAYYYLRLVEFVNFSNSLCFKKHLEKSVGESFSFIFISILNFFFILFQNLFFFILL